MTTWDDRRDADDALATLVVDAVADVEPGDALAALRARTRTPARRRWVVPTLAAGVVAAATVVAVAAVDRDPAPTAEPTPLTSPSASPSGPTPSPVSPTDIGSGAVVLVPATVYYVGDTTAGPRLYRELHPVASTDALSGALDLAVSQAPDDSSYQMPWTDGVHASGSWDGDTITVDVTSPQTQAAGMGIVDRSPGMTEKEAALAVQQLVYTAQDAVGEGRVPVRFLVDGEPSRTLLGVPTVGPTRAAPPLDTLSLITLDSPQEGQTYAAGDTLEFAGEAASFEGNVTWRLQRYEGMEVIDQGNVTAEGSDGFYPFSGEVDLTGVPAGRYTFMVWTDDPSGEGNSFTDDRVITIE